VFQGQDSFIFTPFVVLFIGRGFRFVRGVLEGEVGERRKIDDLIVFLGHFFFFHCPAGLDNRAAGFRKKGGGTVVEGGKKLPRAWLQPRISGLYSVIGPVARPPEIFRRV